VALARHAPAKEFKNRPSWPRTFSEKVFGLIQNFPERFLGSSGLFCFCQKVEINKTAQTKK
jgi:hypothetical protein